MNFRYWWWFQFFENFTRLTIFHKKYFENFNGWIRKFQFENFIHPLYNRHWQTVAVAPCPNFVHFKIFSSSLFNSHGENKYLLKNKYLSQYLFITKLYAKILCVTRALCRTNQRYFTTLKEKQVKFFSHLHLAHVKKKASLKKICPCFIRLDNLTYVSPDAGYVNL